VVKEAQPEQDMQAAQPPPASLAAQEALVAPYTQAAF
jgi:hypothetical protein